MFLIAKVEGSGARCVCNGIGAKVLAALRLKLIVPEGPQPAHRTPSAFPVVSWGSNVCNNNGEKWLKNLDADNLALAKLEQGYKASLAKEMGDLLKRIKKRNSTVSTPPFTAPLHAFS